MRVLLTGIVGIKLDVVAESLRRCAREGDLKRTVLPPLKAEKYFLDVIEATKLLPDRGLFLNRSQYMIQALGLPRPLVRSAWSKAFARLMEESASEQGDAYLCLHTVFYHQTTREFFSPIDTEMVKAWRPSIVVTVIDDIQDCLERLRAEGEMFSESTYAQAGIDGFHNAVQHMQTLYDWRASEVLAAERLAADLEVPHFCVAAKHPAETLASLVYEKDRQVCYISHPISEPRRQLNAGNTEGFRRFCEGLERTCSRLRRAVVLIEPTTIDELRLRGCDGPDGRVFLPKHTARWPVHNDAMWARPDATDRDPLDPGAYFSDELLSRYSEYKGRQGTEAEVDLASEIVPVEIAARLLTALVTNMKAQIDARDHKLVEQTQGLIVLRPIYRGNVSDGVLEEIRYHCQLCASGEPRAGGLWVFSTPEDEYEWLCVWLRTRLRDWLSSGKAKADNMKRLDELDSIIKGVIRELKPIEDRNALVSELLKSLEAKGIRLVGRSSNGALDPRPEASSGSARAAFIQECQAAKPPYVEIVESYDVPYTRTIGPENSVDDFIGQMLESAAHAAGAGKGSDDVH